MRRALFAAGGVLFLLVAMQIVGPWLAGRKERNTSSSQPKSVEMISVAPSRLWSSAP